MKKKAQVWSIDTLVAFFVFLSALAFFMIYVSQSQDPAEIVKHDAEFIPQVLSSETGSVPLMQQSSIDKDTLQTLVNMNYEDLKGLLGVQSDFCIFFVDNEGNLVNISEALGLQDGSSIFGIGSNEINITPTIRCGK